MYPRSVSLYIMEPVPRVHNASRSLPVAQTVGHGPFLISVFAAAYMRETRDKMANLAAVPYAGCWIHIGLRVVQSIHSFSGSDAQREIAPSSAFHFPRL